MSRIGRQPVAIPDGVQVKVADSEVVVEGPKGRLSQRLRPEVQIEVNDGQLVVNRTSDVKRQKSFRGPSCSLVGNMVEWVTKGFQKNLELKGMGYREQKQGNNMVLAVGYSQPVEIVPPEGID